MILSILLIMSFFGEIKKSLSSFLLDESGEVTEQSVLCLGAILGGAAVASAAHASSADISFVQPNKEAGAHSSAHSSCHTSCHSSHNSCHGSCGGYASGHSSDPSGS